MQCPGCSATIPNDLASCPQCGTPLRTGPQSPHGRPDSPGQHGAAANRGSPAEAGPSPAGHDQADRSGSATQTRSRAGDSFETRVRTALGHLPWRSGLVGGGLLYVMAFAVFALLTSQIGASRPLETATTLFTGLLTFVSASDVAREVGPTLATLPPELRSGQFDALLGLSTLFVPYVLYAAGKRFADWRRSASDDPLAAVATGTTVVVGTVPVVALVTLGFGGDVVHDTLVAGLLVPGLAGGIGGLASWGFRGVRRSASWGTGVVTGLVGFGLLIGLTFVWAQPGAGLGQGALVDRLVAALVAFVGVTTLAFGTGATGLLAYLAVPLPIVVFGYYRARRTPAIAGPGDGAVAGASLVAGFSTFAFVVLGLYTFLASPATPKGDLSPLGFLPQSLSALPSITSLGDVLWAFLLAALLVPLAAGGVGGAIGGYRDAIAAGVSHADDGRR